MGSKFIVGFAAGIVAGILLAPDKGSNTRKRLAEAKNDVIRDIKQSISTGLDEVARSIKDVKTNLEAANDRSFAQSATESSYINS